MSPFLSKLMLIYFLVSDFKCQAQSCDAGPCLELLELRPCTSELLPTFLTRRASECQLEVLIPPSSARILEEGSGKAFFRK